MTRKLRVFFYFFIGNARFHKIGQNCAVGGAVRTEFFFAESPPDPFQKSWLTLTVAGARGTCRVSARPYAVRASGRRRSTVQGNLPLFTF